MLKNSSFLPNSLTFHWYEPISSFHKSGIYLASTESIVQFNFAIGYNIMWPPQGDRRDFMELASPPSMSDPRGPERVFKIVFGLVLVLPLLIWIIASIEMRRTLLDDARERTVRMADLLHEHASKVFETQELVAEQVDQLLFGLSDEDIVAREAILWPRFRVISERLPQLQDIWVLDSRGHPLIVTNFTPAPRTLDLSDRAYFRAHLNSGPEQPSFFISEPLRGRADPRRIFFQLSRVRRVDGAFHGVTALSIEPNYFASFYASVASSGYASLSLNRADGIALAQYPNSANVADDPRPNRKLADAIQKAPEKGTYVESFGDQRADLIVAYRKLQGHGAYVVVGFDTAIAEAQWWDRSVGHLYFGIPGVVGLLLLLGIAFRQNRREYDSLRQLQAETMHRRELESQLHHAQRLESLGRLTGGVAHDFNNLLAVVSGSLELLRKRLVAGADKERQLIDRALAAVERGSLLIRRLLSFARQQSLEPTQVDANRILMDVAEMARLSVGPNVAVETSPSVMPAWMKIDCGQFEAALLNLCINARDALTDRGTIRLTCAAQTLHPAEAAPLGLASGAYVIVTVQDDGHGMSEEVLQKAAEPFFTTKAPGFGTGLGLSQVHDFISQSGGKLQLQSKVGQGTLVTLYLPQSEPEVIPQPALAEGALPRGRADETILLVDDDMAVRVLTSETLTAIGYEVIQADGAMAAMTVLKTGTPVTAVLTDIMMPIQDGWSLAAEIAKYAPDLPVVFMTGFDPNDDLRSSDAIVLRKPFSMLDLASAMRRAIDQKLQSPEVK